MSSHERKRGGNGRFARADEAAAVENSASDNDLLEEIRKNYDYDMNAWRHIVEEGAIDMRYVSGDPWDPKDKEQRKAAGRPALALDELGQYFNQVINEARLNQRAAKFDPVGDGANDESARFYADKWREVEYRSRAQIVYTTALQNAIHRSYGWMRVKTEYEPGSFNQELVLEEFVNPDMVIPDVDAKRPTFSDMRHCFVVETWKLHDYRRRYPKAKVTDFSQFELSAPQWIKGDSIQIAEYWRIEMSKRQLVAVELSDGSQLEGDEESLSQQLPKGVTIARILREREEDMPSVVKYMTNGVEILERTPWAGKYIPIVACVGLMLYVNNGAGTERQLLSMTRLARDPYMLFCYYKSTEAEVVGMTPRVPAVGYKGQFDGHETDWQNAAHMPIAYLQANAKTEETGEAILPLPQRMNYAPPIEAMAMGAEGARRAIQSAMGGSPLPTSAQRRNEKSGVALKQIETTQQKGNFHFLDHYEDMIQHAAVIGEDLMDKVYDSARKVGVRQADGKAKVVTINDPRDPESVLTQGRHGVTISTGPSFESEREAASDFADTLASIPNVFPLIAPLIVKLKNLGPIGDEIAEKLKFLQPPEMRAEEDAKNGEQHGPDPRELQQQLQELGMQLEEASKALNEMSRERDGKVIENRVKYDIALLNAQTEMEKAKLDVDKAIRVATINASARLRSDATRIITDDANQDADREQELILAGAHMEQAAVSQQAAEAGAVDEAPV